MAIAGGGLTGTSNIAQVVLPEVISTEIKIPKYHRFNAAYLWIDILHSHVQTSMGWNP